MKPSAREVLTLVADWFDGSGFAVSLDPKDARFWATMVILVLMLIPGLVVVQFFVQG